MRAICLTVIVGYAAAVGFCSPSVAAEAPELKILSADSRIEIFSNDRPVLAYRFAAAPFKPYVQQLYTPGGVQILRDSPPDHVHHHGQMFAIGVDGVDFWTEPSKAANHTMELGKQVPREQGSSTVTIVDGDRQAAIRQTIDWLDAAGKPLLEEQRKILLHADSDVHATLETWKCRLRPAAGKASVQLWGRHYFGLGMRFVKSMDGAGTFLNSAGSSGETVRGTEKLTRAAWCAYRAPVDGKWVTVAMFGHPDNTRHPTTWFTMTKPFAYLSATLELHRRPIKLERGKPLELIYGVALWDGKQKSEEIERVYQKWLADQ